ncbi:MAG: T9SS type A sorting domain-containing protein [Bacteroidetes bacterium]|nr:T9SS type A sorting domain-containing protein [Bacteroidota bacterium]
MTKTTSVFLAGLLCLIICIPVELSAQVTVTGSTGANSTYGTLKAAFDAINSNANQSNNNIVITITANTTETATASLTGHSTNSWASLTIYPTATVTISGAVAGSLIQLDGADYVTIDGSISQTGATVNMTIENTSTSSDAGTSTVSFINDANVNTLQDCNVLGSSMAANGGIIYFGSGSDLGNNNNIVSNCNISHSGSNRPVNALYSTSTSGVNSQNTIASNNFYDFFNAGYTSYGINLGSGTSNWSIYYNSFYETTSFAPGSSSAYYGIYVDNISGTTFNISNNYIGGSAASCGGVTAFTKTNIADNVFYGIYINAGGSSSSDWSNVNGNTIKNITWANSGNAAFYGIEAANGYLNIGTTGAGNTIGAASGNGAVTYTAGSAGGNIYGIRCTGSNVVSVAGNTLGAVTANNSVANLVTNVYGIYCSGGNTNPGNTISGNTILNIVNNAGGAAALVNGIYVGAGKNSVTGNTVHDLSMPNSNNILSNYELSAGGIVVYVTTAATQTITGNTIYNISNTYSAFSGSVAGIYYSGSNLGCSISGNFIYNILATCEYCNGNVYGIKADAGSTTFSNNIIYLLHSLWSTLYGIYEPGTSGNTTKIYFNTVYFDDGLSDSRKNSYCLYSAGNESARDFRNNILDNIRNGEIQYDIYFAAVGGTIINDYNDYYSTGTIIGHYGVDKTDIPIVTGQDLNSRTVYPNFVNDTPTTPSDFYPKATPFVGQTITGITTDYRGIPRSSPPTIGAIEGQIEVTWNGSSSTDWSLPANWSGGMVPVSVQNVTIPNTTNKPHVITDPSSCAEINNLTIASGAVLTIDAGKALAVDGILTNNAGVSGLVISSSATATGMLYLATAGVSATVERHIAGWDTYSPAVQAIHGWHFLSSPVASQTISSGFTVSPETNYDLYAWWEPTDQWVNYKNVGANPTWTTANVLNGSGSATNFIPGKGYMAAYAGSSTKTFTGFLNVADIPVSGLTSTGAATYKGWNLLGNPFSSPLRWNNPGGGWALSNIDANCQIWDEANASYTTISPGSLIPESNGFMVHVSSPGTGSLTIPALSMRFSPAPWYKSGESEENRIVFKAVDPAGQTAQATIISFDPAATEGFDPRYDSYFLAGYAPKFYSVSRNKEYALNCLPELNSSLIIPLSFIKNNGSDFGIELIGNIPGTNVYLTDLKLNKTQNLANEPVYSFSSSSADSPERFQLSFVINGKGEENKAASGIYAWENSVYVRNQGTSELQIYNLTGQTVFSEKISQQGLYQAVLNITSGYYIVRLTGDAGVTVRKIHIDHKY